MTARLSIIALALSIAAEFAVSAAYAAMERLEAPFAITVQP